MREFSKRRIILKKFTMPISYVSLLIFSVHKINIDFLKFLILTVNLSIALKILIYQKIS